MCRLTRRSFVSTRPPTQSRAFGRPWRRGLCESTWGFGSAKGWGSLWLGPPSRSCPFSPNFLVGRFGSPAEIDVQKSWYPKVLTSLLKDLVWMWFVTWGIEMGMCQLGFWIKLQVFLSPNQQKRGTLPKQRRKTNLVNSRGGALVNELTQAAGAAPNFSVFSFRASIRMVMMCRSDPHDPRLRHEGSTESKGIPSCP